MAPYTALFMKAFLEKRRTRSLPIGILILLFKIKNSKRKSLKQNCFRLFLPGDEGIEPPPKVLETPIIPLDQSPICACRTRYLYHTYRSFVNVYFMFSYFLFHFFYFYIFLNTESNTFPSARTKTAAAIASGIPDAVIVPIISPQTAVTPTSLACAYSFANNT